MPTITVIMPTYNRAHLLEPVIRSILEQDYRDMELLIVDDGSTDNTEELIADLSKSDNRLHYLLLAQNCGIGCARDAGLEHAKSHAKYIAFADSDDPWVPNRLGRQIAILDQYPQIDILFGDFDNINHVQGTRASGMRESQIGLDLLKLKQLEESLYLIERGIEKGLLRSNFIAAPTIVLRTRIIETIGGFNPQLRNPDLEFSWRAAVRGARFAYMDEYLIERHLVEDSNTAQGAKPLVERLDALEACRQIAKGQQNQHELETYIKDTENRTYIKILRHYGEQGDRKALLQFFPQSLRHGFNLRIIGTAILGLFGPFAIDGLFAALRLKKKVQENDLSAIA